MDVMKNNTIIEVIRSTLIKFNCETGDVKKSSVFLFFVYRRKLAGYDKNFVKPFKT